MKGALKWVRDASRAGLKPFGLGFDRLWSFGGEETAKNSVGRELKNPAHGNFEFRDIYFYTKDTTQDTVFYFGLAFFDSQTIILTLPCVGFAVLFCLAFSFSTFMGVIVFFLSFFGTLALFVSTSTHSKFLFRNSCVHFSRCSILYI